MVHLDHSAATGRWRPFDTGGMGMSTFREKNLHAALTLAHAGFFVFPAHPIFNKETKRWNKPPFVVNWQSLATTDPRQIHLWWREYRDAVPAICCDDFVVIDADRHAGSSDGVAALAELAGHHCEWPDHPKVLTPSNGEHHIFAQPDSPVGNRTGQLPPGIDVRGNGGWRLALEQSSQMAWDGV